MALARARDVLRNDAFMQAAEFIHRDSIVGAVFMLNAKPNLRALGMRDDKVWLREFQEEIESKFALFAESPERWIDAARTNTLTEHVRLAVGVALASGEILATAEWIRDRVRPFNTAIQMIEVERLCNPYGSVNTGRMRDGVLKDRYGAPLSYFIRSAHPSDLVLIGADAYKWTEYPARMSWGRRRIIHIKEQARIDQTRGISQMTAALKEVRMFRRWREIELQNAITNATFAASIESELPMRAYEALGGGDDDDLIDYADRYLDAVSDYSGGAKSLTIDGIRIPHLYPGEKLQLRPAGKGGGRGTEFEESSARYLAAAAGVTYEEFSKNLKGANYTTLRAGMTWTHKFMNARKRMYADSFATEIYRLWFEEAVNKGEIETIKGRPDFYDGQNKDAYTQCDWLGQGRGQIDELKETQAAVLRIRNNLSTVEDETAKLGKDWRAIYAQRAEEKELEEELGLTTPEDQAMLNAASGENNSDEGDNPDGEGRKNQDEDEDA